MRILVTGGAGYIGAHTVQLLGRRGDVVLVVDDLVTGDIRRVPGVPVIRCDLASDGAREVIASALREYSIDAVIHFAARKQVGESVLRPAWYYQQNVGGLAQLLLAMEDTGVRKLVFSSSAAVYGHANGAIDEGSDTVPANPYGATKRVGEQLIDACGVAWGLSAASLRYFNVGGAGSVALGDKQALNLIPIAFEALANGAPPVIFGDDYDTPDGSCIRDYVHVLDVAEAHLAVLDALPDEPGNLLLNLGTGVGTSVKQMLAEIVSVAGSELEPIVNPRRAGDPASVVAVVDRIRELTGWTARYGLDGIVQSAWESRQYFSQQDLAQQKEKGA